MSPYLRCKIHTPSPPIIIPHPPNFVCSIAPPFLLHNSLYFIECRCDYMGFCVCLTGVKGILSWMFLALLHKHIHRDKHTRTHTVLEHLQRNVNSPLQRDVLLIGLSLVTVWEDEFSRRFLCRVVTGASMS